jgi:hypothetical protein
MLKGVKSSERKSHDVALNLGVWLAVTVADWDWPCAEGGLVGEGILMGPRGRLCHSEGLCGTSCSAYHLPWLADKHRYWSLMFGL